MIFRHYRNWMPSLRRGHGQRLVAMLGPDREDRRGLDPKVGPKPLRRIRKPRIVRGLGVWRRGESNPRPKMIRQSFSVRSLVFCSRPFSSHGQDLKRPARFFFDRDLQAWAAAYPDLRRLFRPYGLEPGRRWLAKQPGKGLCLRIVVRSLDFVRYQDPVARYSAFSTSVEPMSPPYWACPDF